MILAIKEMENSDLVCVSEKGKLHVVSARNENIRIELKGTVKRLQEEPYPAELQKQTFYEKSVTKDGFNVYSPCSLLNICMEFVGTNITAVESLWGFPDIIGWRIFKASSKAGIFRKADAECLTALTLFCNAYGGNILECLNLRDSCKVIDEYFDHLCKFTSLCEIDLSMCRVGDEHDILMHIAQLVDLQKLNLMSNALSDKGIQKLTIPHRVWKRGLQKLRVLYLTDNDLITDSSIKHLVSLQSLMILDLTGTSATKKGLSMMKEQLQMVRSHQKSESFHCENTGWAADVINTWKQSNLLPPAKKRKTNPKDMKLKSFYGKKTPVMQSLKDPSPPLGSAGKMLLMKRHSPITEEEKDSRKLNCKSLFQRTKRNGNGNEADRIINSSENDKANTVVLRSDYMEDIDLEIIKLYS
ncbi:leucine-rich repeat-containing protein 42 [Lingula anatina]|uniref:Leucine-rich repeat-containing protein 42 n=1 Tax=Lingula anatina TaxID=7574 RepID=A0A1S3IMK0_LINAN|nr:leucine-rich repeat-containing protein 42 [Lingula anatina]XP_023932132.1 leucine-rich repeat-containing protein 42 [Lingula anatina]XP_023932133.1 leucine-rich repeat-containing protein 42 [Lingula anatina]XP_023932134.1 leucine-rich repeat-containing protein 42 [Lingula anatina]|eukprot:XP_013399427.1 leucine-rich repeat-containing protein 42 [Lingula anatina]